MEIGFLFDRRLERQDVFVAFVRELVAEVEHKHFVEGRIAHLTGKPTAPASTEVLVLASDMLCGDDRADLIARAAAVHDACHSLNPDDAIPTNHTIDMLSSCASAIRFGLEDPPHSRHAAEAANHVWSQVYGVSRFDQHTGAWEKAWAREKLVAALLSLLPPEGVAIKPPADGEVRDAQSAPNDRTQPHPPGGPSHEG